MSLPVHLRLDPNRGRRFGKHVTPLECQRQFKPFVYLNPAAIMGICLRALECIRKVPPCDGTFWLNVQSATSGPWASGPDGPDPVAADRASGRRPAAVGRASAPGSGSAGPGSGSDWSFGAPLFGLHGRTTSRRPHWLPEHDSSCAIIPRRPSDRIMTAEPPFRKYLCTSPLSRS